MTCALLIAPLLSAFDRRLEVFTDTLSKGGADAAGAQYERKEEVPGGVVYYYRDPHTGALHKKFSPRKGREHGEAEPDDATNPHVQVREDADAHHITHHDTHHPIPHHDWSARLGPLYGKALLKGLGAEPGRGARMVLSLVDEALLKDLEGEDDDARLADLARKAPQVLEALQEKIKAARASSLEVKQRLVWLMGRQGWSGAARAELLGELLGPRGDLVADNFAMLALGAENLAGGQPVAAVHVSAATALRDMGAGDWPDEVKRVGEAAQKELGELLGLLTQARKDPTKAASVLRQVASSDAMHKLRALALAWPGLEDEAAAGVRDALLEVPSAAPRDHVTAFGSHCNVYVAGEQGRASARRARYKLVEATDLITSHDPTTFAPHALYPQGLQERRYHDDKAEQQKVVRNAHDLRADYLINTNPDGVNGPPVVTQDNLALGGNSRGMSTLRAYRDGKGDAYRAHLLENAAAFGFKPQDVKALVAPVLVRELEGEGHDLHLLVRQLNESQTQAMDPRTLAVAQARKLSAATLDHLSEHMREEESLSDFLSTQRSADFVAGLSRDGLIDERNANAYKSGNLLSRDGRTMVERVLVGHLFGDADLLTRLPDRTISALARSAPLLLQARAHGEAYDLAAPLRLASDAYARLREQSKAAGVEMPSGAATKEQYLASMDRLGSDLFGDGHPVFGDERAAVLLEVLVRRPGEAQMAQVVRAFAVAASKNPQGQASLFGGNDPKQARQRALEVFHDSITRGLGDSFTALPKEKEASQPASQQAPVSSPDQGDKEAPAQTPTPQEAKPQGEPKGQAGLFGDAPPAAPAPAQEEDEEPKAPTHKELEEAGQTGLFLSMYRVWRAGRAA